MVKKTSWHGTIYRGVVGDGVVYWGCCGCGRLGGVLRVLRVGVGGISI